MTKERALYAAAAIVTLAVITGAFVLGDQTASEEAQPPLQAPLAVAETKPCDGLGMNMTDGECFAAGAIRFVFFYNEQGAAQFCKWQAANPGEWTRIKGYAASSSPPSSIVTWQGAALKNALEAYFATGAPAFTIQPNTAPNRCKTPLPPPMITGVTPGQTDATVTVGG